LPDDALSSTAGPCHAPDDPGRDAVFEPHDSAELWDLIREVNATLRRSTDRNDRAVLSRRRAEAWEQLTINAVDADVAPWYSAACACAAEVATEAAEYAERRRRPRLL